MNDVFKKIVVYIVTVAVVVGFLSTYYFVNQFSNSREIGDVDNLTGQRIGVITAYEGDYLLSDRDDITLQRYDTQADLLIALCYKQVDAVALTDDMAKYIVDVSTGFKINDKPIATNNVASLFRNDSKLIGEYEEFLEVIKANGEYDKFIERYQNGEYYDGSPITEQTGTGEVIKVGYLFDFIPVVFEDAINKCPNGSEVDIFIMFANYMNYKIDWVVETETSGLTDIYYGNIDCLLAGYSEIYRDECDKSEYLDMGPNYRDANIVLLEVEDYDNIKIGELKEGE